MRAVSVQHSVHRVIGRDHSLPRKNYVNSA